MAEIPKAITKEGHMNDTTAPARGLGLNDRVEHDLMPGFVMVIKGVATCETDATRREEHDRYKITDPDGNEDWLCAYDVHPAIRESP